MSNLNRRNLIRGAALAPLLGALPALACSAEADPSIIAVNAYKVARAAYVDACKRGESDDEVDATGRVEGFAAIAALSTVPTSPAGLRSLCEFASWLVSVDEGELSEWRPGFGIAGADQRTGEDMYFATLAAAAAALLPAAAQDMGTMPVCVPVPAPARHDPLADMIRAFHDEEVVMRAFPGDIPEDFEHAAWNALSYDELPPAQSREVALDALRLSVRFGDEAPGDYAASNLARAALAFFEANA